MRKAALATLLLVTLAGSFLLTLRLTETRAPPSAASDDDRFDVERWASQRIADRADLIEAAIAAGLHSADRMRGRVDAIRRINESEVMIIGWLVDPSGQAENLTVVVFVAGQRRAVVETRGERPDVTNAFKLPFGTEKNVAFQTTAACRKDERIMIVGLGPDKQYLHLSSAVCP